MKRKVPLSAKTYRAAPHDFDRYSFGTWLLDVPKPKPYRYLAITGRRESIHKNKRSAEVIAGKRGRVVPLYK